MLDQAESRLFYTNGYFRVLELRLAGGSPRITALGSFKGGYSGTLSNLILGRDGSLYVEVRQVAGSGVYHLTPPARPGARWALVEVYDSGSTGLLVVGGGSLAADPAGALYVEQGHVADEGVDILRLDPAPAIRSPVTLHAARAPGADKVIDVRGALALANRNLLVGQVSANASPGHAVTFRQEAHDHAPSAP